MGYKIEDTWSNTITDAYFWMLISNNLIIMAILNCISPFNYFSATNSWSSQTNQKQMLQKKIQNWQ
jgi:hypothetical protein